MNVLHRIRQAVNQCVQLTAKPPRAIYLGAWLYKEFEHSPEVQEGRNYQTSDAPIHERPILWEGVQIIEVLRSPSAATLTRIKYGHTNPRH